MKYHTSSNAKVAVVWRNNGFGKMLSNHLQAEFYQPTEMERMAQKALKKSYDIIFLLLECQEQCSDARLPLWRKLLSCPALVDTQIHIYTVIGRQCLHRLLTRIGLTIHVLPQSREMFCKIIRQFKAVKSSANARVRIKHLLHEANSGSHTNNFLADLEHLATCQNWGDYENFLKTYEKLEGRLTTFEKALDLYKDELKRENKSLYNRVFVLKYYRIHDVMDAIRKTVTSLRSKKSDLVCKSAKRFEILKDYYFKKESLLYNHFITQDPC